MEKKLSFDVDQIKLLEAVSDAQLAIAEIWVCHTGDNLNNYPISIEALKVAAPTLLNKFLVADFNGRDFTTHTPTEAIIGFFPKENDLRYLEKDGKTYLVANAILSKVYADWAYSIFADEDNHRPVSMEITVLETKKIDDKREEILSFVFNGVTVLGERVQEACVGSDIEIKKFSVEEGEKVYQEYLFSKEITNFPIQGDNKKVSLSNSNFPQFDFQYAKKIKEDYPWLWKKGGNIRGNEAFEYWSKAKDGENSDGIQDWIKEREAWSARHHKDKNLAGVIANIKWGTIVSRGEKYMKDTVNAEIDKHEPKKMFEENIATSVEIDSSKESEVSNTITNSDETFKEDMLNYEEKKSELDSQERNDEKVDRKEMKAKMSAVIGECKYQKDDAECMKYSKAISYDDNYVYAIDKETGNMSAIPYAVENEEVKCSYDAVKMAKLKCEAYEEGEDEEAVMMALQEVFSSDANTESTAQEELEEKQANDNDEETKEDNKEEDQPDVHDEMMEAIKAENAKMQAENEDMKVKMSAMEEELGKLKEFQASTLESQRKAQIEFALKAVASDLPVEKINEWKEKASEYSNISEWENAMQAEAYRFSKTVDKKEEQDFIQIPIIEEKNFSENVNKSKSIWDKI